jgi:hypothetical protein
MCSLYACQTCRYLFRLKVILLFICLPGFLAYADKSDNTVSAYTFEQAEVLLQTYCLYCHGANEPQAGLNLARFNSLESIPTEPDIWTHVAQRVRNGEMPPKNALPLEMEEREIFADWIERTLLDAVCSSGFQPGPAPLRRLNRDEYANTIRDLLGIHFNAGHNLPEDSSGGAGFDNAAETLFISPVHAERYLDAAREALDYAAKDSNARERIFIALPDGQTRAEEAARTVLEQFATRAFRRPVTADELESLMLLYFRATEAGEPFDAAVFYAMQAVLISPNFLFLLEEPNPTSEIRRISDFELASRLSYFLWSSMPDDELFQLAAEGKLHERTILWEQMNRMLTANKFGRQRRRPTSELEDLRFHEFANSFVSQWLGTRDLGRTVKPDRNLFERYNQELEAAMKIEPVFLFQEIIVKDLSLLNLIDSDFTYVNRQLARHYGILDDVEVDNQQPQQVKLPEGSHRGGVVTMAGILTVSSFSHRTSPVLRGKWIMESILGTPPPPPPPNIPELPENTQGEPPKTLRERLSIHRENPACASCHDRIDPLGFSLENFDPIGRWRTEDAGKPIDSSGQMPNGFSFEGAEGLKQVLFERKDEFIRHLTVKMLGYALGRGLVREDYCTVEDIINQLEENHYSAQTLIWEIITSVPFQYHPANEITETTISQH